MERFAVFFLMIGLTFAAQCEKDFFWGEDCVNMCGYCLEDNLVNITFCDKVTGACPENKKDGTAHCALGWAGPGCSDAQCEGGCNGGTCISPDVCFCGSDINKVGPTCEDIRVRGVIGSIAAFATVTASIALCGLGSKLYKRRKEGASL